MYLRVHFKAINSTQLFEHLCRMKKNGPLARQTNGRGFERGNDPQNMEVEGGPSREPFETMPADILRGDPDMWVGG